MTSQNRATASAEVVAKRLGERLRMGNEDRRARRDAEQRVKDAAREVQKELMKLNAFAATARREAKDDRDDRRAWGKTRAPSTTPRASTRVCGTTRESRASEAKAAAAANVPRDVRDARSCGWAGSWQPTCFGTDPETMAAAATARRRRAHGHRAQTKGGAGRRASHNRAAPTAACAWEGAQGAFSQRKQRREPQPVGVGGDRVRRLGRHPATRAGTPSDPV